jgi:hypothetical protein
MAVRIRPNRGVVIPLKLPVTDDGAATATVIIDGVATDTP